MKRSYAIRSFPKNFRVQKIEIDGATIHVRAGGKGPAVVMLHGFGDTGDMWAPVAAVLIHNHTVVVPDLRGMGLSSHPQGGYEKKTQARDIAQVMDKLNIDRADFVTHDIGNMVGYAFAAQFPARVTRWVVIDAPLPGIGPWDDILRSPALWHFNFRGPDAERLVKGRDAFEATKKSAKAGPISLMLQRWHYSRHSTPRRHVDGACGEQVPISTELRLMKMCR